MYLCTEPNCEKIRIYALIEVSIVSHGHGQMVDKLVCQVLQFSNVSKIILTQNIPEYTEYADNSRVRVIRNLHPKGFGHNHNRAASGVSSPFFCILNPDIEFKEDPFPMLLRSKRLTNSSVIAPMIINADREIEDSVRYFPGFFSLIEKVMGINDGSYQVSGSNVPFAPDWIAGMFMLFDIASFHEVGGFDEGFFLYYEDVDLCARLWKRRLKVAYDPSVSVIHNAQRSSRRNIRYMFWHASSMMRYFIKHWGRLPNVGEI